MGGGAGWTLVGGVGGEGGAGRAGFISSTASRAQEGLLDGILATVCRPEWGQEATAKDPAGDDALREGGTRDQGLSKEMGAGLCRVVPGGRHQLRKQRSWEVRVLMTRSRVALRGKQIGEGGCLLSSAGGAVGVSFCSKR